MPAETGRQDIPTRQRIVPHAFVPSPRQIDHGVHPAFGVVRAHGIAAAEAIQQTRGDDDQRLLFMDTGESDDVASSRTADLERNIAAVAQRRAEFLSCLQSTPKQVELDTTIGARPIEAAYGLGVSAMRMIALQCRQVFARAREIDRPAIVRIDQTEIPQFGFQLSYKHRR